MAIIQSRDSRHPLLHPAYPLSKSTFSHSPQLDQLGQSISTRINRAADQLKLCVPCPRPLRGRCRHSGELLFAAAVAGFLDRPRRPDSDCRAEDGTAAQC